MWGFYLVHIMAATAKTTTPEHSRPLATGTKLCQVYSMQRRHWNAAVDFGQLPAPVLTVGRVKLWDVQAVADALTPKATTATTPAQ